MDDTASDGKRAARIPDIPDFDRDRLGLWLLRQSAYNLEGAKGTLGKGTVQKVGVRYISLCFQPCCFRPFAKRPFAKRLFGPLRDNITYNRNFNRLTRM